VTVTGCYFFCSLILVKCYPGKYTSVYRKCRQVPDTLTHLKNIKNILFILCVCVCVWFTPQGLQRIIRIPCVFSCLVHLVLCLDKLRGNNLSELKKSRVRGRAAGIDAVVHWLGVGLMLIVLFVFFLFCTTLLTFFLDVLPVAAH